MNYCIGDSHISIFSKQSTVLECTGWQQFGNYNINHVGPSTAYNVGEKPQIITMCDNVPKSNNLILSFGEIDGRCRVGREPYWKENIELIVERYCRFIKGINHEKISLLAITPCVMEEPMKEWFDADRERNDIFVATRGTLRERNLYKKTINDSMRKFCVEMNYGFIDLWGDVIGNRDLYIDDIHLDGDKIKHLLP